MKIVIVGAGIVGLAAAYQIQKVFPGAKVVVLEKEEAVASHQTSRNSGVIHSGIYYKPGSLKAKNCILGYTQLLEFCRENEVPHELCGKLIVATHATELPSLQNVYQRGQANGLQGLKLLRPDEIRNVEPHAAGIQAILVPHTGIVDYRVVAEKLVEKVREKGGEIRTGHRVHGWVENRQGIVINTDQGSVEGDYVIFCAGLFSDRLAIKSFPMLDMRIIPFRGEYYFLKEKGESLVKNLIYPVPNPDFPFLGVHFTRMISGGVEIGPNAVLALAREGYRWRDFDLRDLLETVSWAGFRKVGRRYWREGAYEMLRSFSKRVFWRSAQKLVPSLELDDLVSGNSGVRAQACSLDGRLVDDFEIRQSGRCIHVINAPSPAATSSFSIGGTLAEYLVKSLDG